MNVVLYRNENGLEVNTLHAIAIRLQYDEQCNMSFTPGDGNSDSLCLLQQPTGVSRGGEDQEGAGCHADDGGHQHAGCTEHDCAVQPRGETFSTVYMYLYAD